LQTIATDTTWTQSVIDAWDASEQATEASLVASISPTNQIEQNYQTVYNIYVNYIAAGSILDSAQLADLLSVATQCPYTGGAIVFKARGILEALYTAPADTLYSFYYNDSSICSTVSTESLRMKIPPTDTSIIVPSFVTAFPNPAKNQINFVYQYAGNNNATLDIYNLMGVKVGEYTLAPNAQKFTLGLSNYSDGIYFYRLVTPCCEVGVGKYIVAK